MHLINRFQNHVTFHRKHFINLCTILGSRYLGRDFQTLFWDLYICVHGFPHNTSKMVGRMTTIIVGGQVWRWARFTSPPAATTHVYLYSTNRVWIPVENVRIWLPFRSEDRACRELSLQIFKGACVLAFYTWFNTFEQVSILHFSLNMGGIYHVTNWAKIILPWVIKILITFYYSWGTNEVLGLISIS